ncbi:MAG: fatty acid desaturase family protein [Hyphomicrobium sp.]
MKDMNGAAAPDVATARAAARSSFGAQDAPRLIAGLKARDNTTNWRHLAFVWAIIVVTISVGLWLESEIVANGHSYWWLLPLFVTTTLIIGASQHQLGGAVHEGVHGLLFENTRLNELASDWLAAFPIYTTSYQYRVQHLAHHQFVNDPERDPDIAQLKHSDHWLDFPVTHYEMVAILLKQLWPPNLIRYTLGRAKFGAIGQQHNPYVDPDAPGDSRPVTVGILFAVATPFIVAGLHRYPGGVTPLIVLCAAFAATIFYFARLPEERFPQSRLQPVISHRVTTIGRMTFLFALYATFAVYDWAHASTFAWDHYGIYWTLALFTTFPLFMMIRQWVQHGNADRGRYTNTRVFLFGPLIRYSVLPWGMDYHLPHHTIASVPHYRLKELHEVLMLNPKYAEQHVEVEGVFGDGDATGRRPTILSMLTQPRGTDAETFVDDAALDGTNVRDRAKIAEEARKSVRA